MELGEGSTTFIQFNDQRTLLDVLVFTATSSSMPQLHAGDSCYLVVRLALRSIRLVREDAATPSAFAIWCMRQSVIARSIRQVPVKFRLLPLHPARYD
ncbi:unnamed protein product [Urochloa humidicola]